MARPVAATDLHHAVETLSSAEAARVGTGMHQAIVASVAQFDHAGAGCLTPRTLEQALRATLPQFSDGQLKALLSEADEESGYIDYVSLIENGLCIETAVNVSFASRTSGGMCSQAGARRAEVFGLKPGTGIYRSNTPCESCPKLGY